MTSPRRAHDPVVFMASSGGLRLRGFALAGALLMGSATGCDELAVQADARVVVTGVGVWPSQLAVLDSAVFTVSVSDVAGNPLSGFPIQWDVEDSTIVSVRPDTAVDGREAMIVAKRSGTSDIYVSLERPGLATSGYETSIATVAPEFALVGPGWQGRVLSRTQSDTIEVEIRTPDGTVITGLPFEWRSSDPEILGVTQVFNPDTDTTAALRDRAARRAHVQARRTGPADVIASIAVAGFETLTQRFRVNVDSITVTIGLPDTLSVADTALADLALRATAGDSLTLPVRWESTPPGLLSIRDLGADSAEIVASRAGDAEVIVTIDPNGFQPQTVRFPVRIEPLQASPSGWSSSRLGAQSGWPDTLAVADTFSLEFELSDFRGLSDKIVPVSWSSSDPSVVAVDSVGTREVTLVANGRGPVTITATVGDGSSFDSVSLTDSVQVMERWISVSSAGGFGSSRGSFGAGHSCALSVQQDLFCWGHWPGDGSESSEDPVAVMPGTKFAQVSAGTQHACALRLSGEILCWGTNRDGELGDGTTFPSLSPIAVRGGRTYTEVSVGFGFSCATPAAGGVQCWGGGSRGQLGQGPDNLPLGAASTPEKLVARLCDPTAPFWDPVFPFDEPSCLGNTGFDTCVVNNPHNIPFDPLFCLTIPGTDMVTVSAGGYHACGLDVDGRAFCWGWNRSGQIGIPADCPALSSVGPMLGGDSSSGLALLPCSTVAQAVQGDLRFESLSARGGEQTCGVTYTGEVYCWGSNVGGQMGTDPFVSNSNEFAPIRIDIGVPGIQAVAAGGFTSGSSGDACALDADGVAYCWGGGEVDMGRRGLPPTRLPDPPEGPVTWESLDGGGSFTCGITTDGAIYCWAVGHWGGGDGSSRPPTRLSEPPQV